MNDGAYRALADDHRRRVLTALLNEASTVVSAHLSATDEREHDARIKLYHHHLPMLADGSYVEWDPASGTIERGPAFDQIRPLVEFHESVTADRVKSSQAESQANTD